MNGAALDHVPPGPTSGAARALRVLIVGGGIAGMAAALALRRRGASVTLIDADPGWRVYGAGISLTGLTLRAFDDLGVLGEVRERGWVHAGMRPRYANGDDLGPPPPPPPRPGAPGAPPVQLGGGILRPELHAILSRHVREAGVTVRLGLRLAALVQDAHGVDVTLSDGESSRHDLVVGADGIHSTLRPMLFPAAAAPRFTGQGCWRFLAPRPPEVDRAEIYFGGRVKLGMAPVSASEVYVFALEHLPANPRIDLAAQATHLDGLLAPFGGHVPTVREQLAADPALAQIVYRPLEWLLLPAPWSVGRVVLIGDAVHATTPHLAAGAGLAAEDGLALADELGRAGDAVPLALANFTERRFERARLVVEQSVRMGELEMTVGTRPQPRDEMVALATALQRPY